MTHREAMGAAAELTCREFVELVTEYLEAALAPAERAAFEAHPADCDPCGDYLAQVEATVAALRARAPEAVEPERLAAIVDAYRRSRPTG
jgi:anti-sigma factor RsiW